MRLWASERHTLLVVGHVRVITRAFTTEVQPGAAATQNGASPKFGVRQPQLPLSYATGNARTYKSCSCGCSTPKRCRVRCASGNLCAPRRICWLVTEGRRRRTEELFLKKPFVLLRPPLCLCGECTFAFSLSEIFRAAAEQRVMPFRIRACIARLLFCSCSPLAPQPSPLLSKAHQ